MIETDFICVTLDISMIAPGGTLLYNWKCPTQILQPRGFSEKRKERTELISCQRQGLAGRRPRCPTRQRCRHRSLDRTPDRLRALPSGASSDHDSEDRRGCRHHAQERGMEERGVNLSLAQSGLQQGLDPEMEYPDVSQGRRLGRDTGSFGREGPSLVTF